MVSFRSRISSLNCFALSQTRTPLTVSTASAPVLTASKMAWLFRPPVAMMARSYLCGYGFTGYPLLRCLAFCSFSFIPGFRHTSDTLIVPAGPFSGMSAPSFKRLEVLNYAGFFFCTGFAQSGTFFFFALFLSSKSLSVLLGVVEISPLG